MPQRNYRRESVPRKAVDRETVGRIVSAMQKRLQMIDRAKLQEKSIVHDILTRTQSGELSVQQLVDERHKLSDFVNSGLGRMHSLKANPELRERIHNEVLHARTAFAAVDSAIKTLEGAGCEIPHPKVDQTKAIIEEMEARKIEANENGVSRNKEFLSAEYIRFLAEDKAAFANSLKKQRKTLTERIMGLTPFVVVVQKGIPGLVLTKSEGDAVKKIVSHLNDTNVKVNLEEIQQAEDAMVRYHTL